MNDGQLNAVLDSIQMSELTAQQADYVKYTVSYDDIKLSSSADKLNIALPSATGVNRKVVTVRVDYDITDEHKVLPLTEPLELKLFASFNYSQSK